MWCAARSLTQLHRNSARRWQIREWFSRAKKRLAVVTSALTKTRRFSQSFKKLCGRKKCFGNSLFRVRWRAGFLRHLKTINRPRFRALLILFFSPALDPDISTPLNLHQSNCRTLFMVRTIRQIVRRWWRAGCIPGATRRFSRWHIGAHNPLASLQIPLCDLFIKHYHLSWLFNSIKPSHFSNFFLFLLCNA